MTAREDVGYRQAARTFTPREQAELDYRARRDDAARKGVVWQPSGEWEDRGENSKYLNTFKAPKVTELAEEQEQAQLEALFVRRTREIKDSKIQLIAAVSCLQTAAQMTDRGSAAIGELAKAKYLIDQVWKKWGLE